MLKFENFINTTSVFNLVGIPKNIKKQCNTKKLPDKTPKLHIITAILRLTKKIKKAKKENREEMKSQILENVQTGNPNLNIKKTETRPKKVIAFKLLPKTHGTLQEYEEDNFDSEIQEIIEILRNALMNMNSDSETRELHSAVNIFVKNGSQTFKEHRKHIEKAILHINSHNISNEQAKIVNIIRSKINKLNEINSIKNLQNKEVKVIKEKNSTISR